MYWGIDLGGTKIEGVVMSEKSPGSIVARERMDTEGSKGYEHILNRIKMLVDYLAEKSGQFPVHIGIGTPGTVDPLTGFLKNSNTLCLNGKPIDKDLGNLLGINVTIANDAN